MYAAKVCVCIIQTVNMFMYGYSRCSVFQSWKTVEYTVNLNAACLLTDIKGCDWIIMLFYSKYFDLVFPFLIIGTQATVSCLDVGTETAPISSTPINTRAFRPRKRPRLEEED